MALILDGYNIIGALGRYQRTDNFAAARDLLVNDTLKAAGWTGREIILVFDAHRSPEGERVELLAGGAVRVIYSAPAQSADDVIERLLDNLSDPSTVYTGDFALQRTALARRSRPRHPTRVRRPPRRAAGPHSPPRDPAPVEHRRPALARSPSEARRGTPEAWFWRPPFGAPFLVPPFWCPLLRRLRAGGLLQS